MSQIDENKANIAANQVAIDNIRSSVIENKMAVYLSRSLIEENRHMILSNYSAAFMGNRQLANQNTDDILTNTHNILSGMDANSDVEQNFIDAAINSSTLKLLSIGQILIRLCLISAKKWLKSMRRSLRLTQRL